MTPAPAASAAGLVAAPGGAAVVGAGRTTGVSTITGASSGARGRSTGEGFCGAVTTTGALTTGAGAGCSTRARSAAMGTSGPSACVGPLPDAVAFSSAISTLSSPAGSAPDWDNPARIAFMRSSAARIWLTISGDADSVASRSWPSTFSAAWATRSSLGRPKKPQVPLIVCTIRKMSPSVAASSGVRSRASRATSSSARFSLVSVKKSASKSSMAAPWATKRSVGAE